jgi:hypothetical protein
MIPGWDRALRTMVVGERAVFRVEPQLAYGETGIPTLVDPNSPVEFDIQLLDVQPPTLNIDFDSIAMADNTPVRTHREELKNNSPRIIVLGYVFGSIGSHKLLYMCACFLIVCLNPIVAHSIGDCGRLRATVASKSWCGTKRRIRRIH